MAWTWAQFRQVEWTVRVDSNCPLLAASVDEATVAQALTALAGEALVQAAHEYLHTETGWLARVVWEAEVVALSQYEAKLRIGVRVEISGWRRWTACLFWLPLQGFPSPQKIIAASRFVFLQSIARRWGRGSSTRVPG